MRILDKMPGHTRLYRRGATYYHRAAVPKDIADTHGKREETFSLRTKDRAVALTRVKVGAVRVDKALLLKLPSNWRKKREVRELSILDAATKAEQLGLAPMSTANLNKAIRRVAAFWNWAEAHYDAVTPALFNGLSMREAVSVRDQRNPFSPAQLSTLFSSPLFTGCRSDRLCAEPEDHSMRGTALFWLPLLGLYTGARLNELCQLTPSNVREEDDIAYLDITNEADGQRIKTSSGKRIIPIHQRLIDLGFLSSPVVGKKKKSGGCSQNCRWMRQVICRESSPSSSRDIWTGSMPRTARHRYTRFATTSRTPVETGVLCLTS